MLTISSEESKALRIIVLRPQVRAQRYGAAHQLIWKKVGITTTYFRSEAVTEESMPTPRAAATFRYLLKNNEYYWQILGDAQTDFGLVRFIEYILLRLIH